MSRRQAPRPRGVPSAVAVLALLAACARGAATTPPVSSRPSVQIDAPVAPPPPGTTAASADTTPHDAASAATRSKATASERTAEVRAFARAFARALERHDYPAALAFFAPDNYAGQRALGVRPLQYIAEGIGLGTASQHRSGPEIHPPLDVALASLQEVVVEHVERVDDYWHVTGRLVAGASVYALDLMVYLGAGQRLEIRPPVG
ncbi:MAG: hypothetical protein IT373_21720 [Polyangiaceae bacterium]|nr:hypothetical protein [Polyangiaceae bacterium]